jgi:D-lactate dehydrogenase
MAGLCRYQPLLATAESMAAGRVKMLDIAEFLHDYVIPNVDIPARIKTPVALHLTCSTRRMGSTRRCWLWRKPAPSTWLSPPISAVARSPATRGCVAGYSTSRTCEIGLSLHGRVTYRSVADLVDRVAHRRNARSSAARASAERADS